MVLDIIKSVILGIVEGITEWLPISSTGHMILVNDVMNTSEGFFGSQIYLYVIQLGAILAIATLYFHKLNPFAPSKTKSEKRDTWQMWFKVAAACVPAAVIGLLFNDAMDKISTPIVVSAMLIVYGIAFIFAEKRKKEPTVTDINQMTYKTAVMIGLFQVLSIIPGTSRSGATILGAILIGCSRGVAAEFSFFLAIPVMFGVSLLKLAPVFLTALANCFDNIPKLLLWIMDFLKVDPNAAIMTGDEWGLLLVGMAVAYVVSLLTVRFLTDYVRRHDFKAFGYYRIALGVLVIAFFAVTGSLI